MWLHAYGCHLKITTPTATLYYQDLHLLVPGEIIRWITPERVLEDGGVIPGQKLRLVVERINDETPVA